MGQLGVAGGFFRAALALAKHLQAQGGPDAAWIVRQRLHVLRLGRIRIAGALVDRSGYRAAFALAPALAALALALSLAPVFVPRLVPRRVG